MVCKHWDSERYFCSHEKRTINPDELSVCSQTCQNHMPRKKSKMVTCKNCGNKFEFRKDRKIEVGTKEYGECPVCGHVNLKTDDEALSKGIE